MDFNEFAYAGKKQKTKTVILSLVATMIGASATVGLAGRTAAIGFPSFWWLACGSVGLLLQAALLSKKIKDLDAGTLPELAGKTISKTAGSLIAIIIVVSWVGIVAAQFVAAGSLISSLLQTDPALTQETIKRTNTIILVALWAILTLYTIYGGQISVVKTDVIQALLILIGIVLSFLYVFCFTKNSSYFNNTPGFSNSLVFKEIQLFNSKFGIMDLINLMFITGGTYFLGPDIISRNIVSKDSNTAKKAAWVSAIFLIIFSLMITLLALWGAVYFNGNGNPLLQIMINVLPFSIRILLIIGLISALLSSADTSLINASVIAEVNIFRGENTRRTRIIVLIISTLALFLALHNQNIISLFLLSYSIYSPGIVFPLSFAIFFYKKRKINKTIWYIGVICGSAAGILNALPISAFNREYLPLAGMGFSLITSILSVIV